MKMVVAVVGLIVICGCNGRSSQRVSDYVNEEAAKKNAVRPGVIVAADSMKVPDPLNEYYFSVKVTSTEESDSGKYEVSVVYGNNDAKTDIILPRGSREPLTPAIRAGEALSSYIVGFRVGVDTAFHDYVLIRANKGKTEMKYLKAYSFQ
jgi:hypothetical protein